MSRFDTPTRSARRALGWSQAQAAAAVRVDQATWSRVERGLQQPRADLLLAMASALNITADDVLAPWKPVEEEAA